MKKACQYVIVSGAVPAGFTGARGLLAVIPVDSLMTLI
jgi:hypothetical protein